MSRIVGGRSGVVVAVVVAVVLALLSSSCDVPVSGPAASGGGSGPSATNAAAAADAGTMSVLFVQQASSGTLTPRAGDGHEHSLQLEGVSPMTTWFSDRPQRRAGTQTTASAVGSWRDVGFVADPPNAALVFADASGNEQIVIVELRDPIYDHAGRLHYRARELDAPTERLEFTQGRSPASMPTTFGAASLFIDDANVTASVSSEGALTPSTSTSTTTSTTAATGTTVGSGTSGTGLCTFTGPVPKPTASPTGAPEVTTQAPGPLPPDPGSGTLHEAYTQFLDLTCTHYQHSYTEDPPAFYYYDCVGFTTYTLHRGAPNAYASVLAATGVRDGFAPTPGQYQQFFTSMISAPTPPAGWQAVPTASAIQPGDLLAWTPDSNNTAEAGHSVLAISAPTALPDGRYELIVMDSTATNHGPDDTRQTSNPLSQRNAPLGSDTSSGAPSADAASPTAPSGLGVGTIGLVTNSSGQVTGVEWTLGTAVEQITFGAGHPMS